MPFYTSKDALLHCKRASFRTQKGVDGKVRRKEIDKEGASLSPSEGGDVRGNGRIWVAEQVSNTASLSPKVVPPQAPPKEGMCLAGYGMLGVGKIKGGEIKAKSSWVNSQALKFLRSKYALSHTIPLSVNS